MVGNAECFLVKCYNQKSKVRTFNALRYKEYHPKGFNFDPEMLPPASESFVKHIQRAYYQ